MRPTNSSPVITRLLEAHGIVLGKTNMEELAEGMTTINPVYGPVLNPYNNLHDVGGTAMEGREGWGGGGGGQHLACHPHTAGLAWLKVPSRTELQSALYMLLAVSWHAVKSNMGTERCICL